MAKRTLNVITGNQGSGKTDVTELLPLRDALVSFVSQKFNNEIAEQWKGFQYRDDFTDVFEKALSAHRKYYEYEPPLTYEQWVHDYAAKFDRIIVSEDHLIYVQYIFEREARRYRLSLLDDFAPDMKWKVFDPEAINRINDYRRALRARFEPEFFLYLANPKVKKYGVMTGTTDEVEIQIPYEDWAYLDVDSGNVNTSCAEFYRNVRVEYRRERNRYVETSAEKFSNLISELLTREQIIDNSADRVAIMCAEKLEAGAHVDLTKYSFIQWDGRNYHIDLARNTKAAGKKIYEDNYPQN